MKKLINLILIPFLLIPFTVLPQSNYNKVGGVGFRIDDSQYFPEERLVPLVNIFNAKGLKFTYCVSFGIYISQALLDYLPQMQLQGFQIADHTPDHQTRFFDVPLSDVPFYQGRNGVDHIDMVYNGNLNVQDTVARICLRVDSVRTDHYIGEGLININGNTVTSVTANEFSNIQLSSNDDPHSMNTIYIPSLNKLFKFGTSNVKNDTIYNLKSFWEEDINLTLNNVEYHKMWLYDVFYTTDALRVMAERTQRMCDLHGITRPTSWVQPGGYHPQLYKADIKEALESMGYFTAGVSADPVPPYYNSYDPNDDRRYGIGWGDFNEEAQTLDKSKKIIADRFAKHYVSIGHSHLLPDSPTVSFPDYLQRTDSILVWCIAKGIPIKTYTEWAELLYKTPQNPYVNVMPSIDVDLDEDDEPDGFYSYSSTDTDGVSGLFNKSFIKTGNGSIFSIIDLGGVEKGENYFGIWIKGTGQIKVEFNPNQYQAYTFTSTSNSWQKYSYTFQVPTTSSAVDAIIVSSENTTDSIKIGGFELRKNSTNQIIPPFLNKPNFDINVSSVPLVWNDNSSNESGFRVRRMFEKENIWRIIKNNLPQNSANWVDNLLDFPDSLGSYDSITVYYEIQAFAGSNNIPSNIDSIRIKTDKVSPVELSSEVIVPPVAFGLDQNFPNPFNPSTKIRYQLPEKSRVYIKVFNSLGEEVATLLDDIKEPGNYEVYFDGTKLSSGIYFYRMQAGDFISTKKMIIIK